MRLTEIVYRGRTLSPYILEGLTKKIIAHTTAPSSPMPFPEKLRVLRYVLAGSTCERALTPVAVIPFAEKSTLSAVCSEKAIS